MSNALNDKVMSKTCHVHMGMGINSPSILCGKHATHEATMMPKEQYHRPVGRPKGTSASIFRTDKGLPICSDHALDASGMMWIRKLPVEN